jgi:hypothetical protein
MAKSRTSVKKTSRDVPDGGQVALTGFVVQSIAALMDALDRDDWHTLAIEPASDDGRYQKVDFLLALDTGKTLVVQVKHSINGITKANAKRWADDLRRGLKADEYRLYLYAPATGGLALQGEISGVQTRVINGEVDVLWHAFSFRVLDYISRTRGHYRPAVISEATKNFVGSTIVMAIESRSWTKAELVQHLVALVDAAERAQARPMGCVDVFLRRIIVCYENGSCREYVKYTFVNRGLVEERVPGWTITWTDADNVVFEQVSDGEVGKPAVHRVRDTVTGAVEMQIEPRWTIGPGESKAVSATIRRNPAIQRMDSGHWIFQDPLLPTDSEHTTEVFLMFPCAGVIRASGALECDARAVRWSFATGKEQRKISALLEPSPPTVTMADLSTRIEAFLQEHE